MSIDVTVIRYGGNFPGEDIVDAYIGSEGCAIARGRNELDDRSSGLQPVDLDVDYQSGLRPGMTVEVHDTEMEEVWVGKVISVSHSLGEVETTSQIRVTRPTEFRTGRA